ncbi:hypothetical protein QCA50_014707 [Cerrena zonata]|uniref:Fungal-type protein kinase domain-containing protein n=1 Tax=Cerrena zonata TaxID=2478898 RepID=A0AAW0FMP9_9APHY
MYSREAHPWVAVIEFYNKTLKAQNFQLYLTVDMCNSAIGPMPIDLFMNEFMKTDHSLAMNVPEDFFSNVGILNGPGEFEMYTPLFDILNNGKINGRNICHNLCFVKTTSNRNNKPNVMDISPDVVAYEGSQPPPKLDWSLLDLFFDLKSSLAQDGYHNTFQNSRQHVEHDTNGARKTRGQIYTYAARQMSDQHRLFVFCVGIYGQFVRFFRIDRSSVTVSARANYIANPKVLVEFLLRYGQLTRTQRGYDPTVSPATEFEKKLFISHVTQYLERVRGNENLREHAGAQKLLESKYPIHKVQVNDAKSGTTHFYLIREPTARYSAMSPCTRATRGYIAVYMPTKGDDLINQEAGHLDWLKDFWRTDGLETEATILHKLRDAGVSHLPIVRCAGDVLFDGETQRTVNDTWRTKEEANTWRRPVGGNSRALIHHRVVEELLHPLSSVINARELVRSGRDISEAIIDAYFKAERLHQDVSFGNVMLKEDASNGQRETAILIDWDYSRPLDAIESAGFYNRRTGTWPFMSIALLKNTNKRHHVLDDMESLYWVLLFAAIHHFKHSGDFRPSLFDHYELHTSPEVIGERPFGGSRKIEWLCAPDAGS